MSGRDRKRDRPPAGEESDRGGKLSPHEVPDVDISTSVKAKSLRFGRSPETKVWFEGEPAERSRSETERENLPDEVEPGVTYRDIQVRWSAASRLAHPVDEIDEGKGEGGEGPTRGEDGEEGEEANG